MFGHVFQGFKCTRTGWNTNNSHESCCTFSGVTAVTLPYGLEWQLSIPYYSYIQVSIIFYVFSNWIICTSWSHRCQTAKKRLEVNYSILKSPTVPFNSVLLPQNMIEPKNVWVWLFTAYPKSSSVFYVLNVFFCRSVIRCFWSQWWTPFGTSPLMNRSEWICTEPNSETCWSSKNTRVGWILIPNLIR